jgi:hypothetical protein
VRVGFTLTLPPGYAMLRGQDLILRGRAKVRL